MFNRKDGRIGLFEDGDGIISLPKVQAVLFTLLLILLINVDTFTSKSVSTEVYGICVVGAGLGAFDTINDRSKKIKMNRDEKNAQNLK